MIEIIKYAQWRKYAYHIPENAQILGVATTGEITGALVKYDEPQDILRNGKYAIIRHGKLHKIDGRKLPSTITGSGPKRLIDTQHEKSYSIKLTDDEAEQAKTINGNSRSISKGLRTALSYYIKHMKIN